MHLTPSRLALCSALTAALALTLGCNSNNTPTSATSSNAALAVPILITDAPSDSLVTFSLTLNSITLTNSAGKTATLLSTLTTIEICHLNGVQEALVTAALPADTYTSATFTFSNPQITYINGSGVATSVTPTLATTTYTDTFASPITISNSSSSLLVDLLASRSVTISGTTVTVSPVFSVTAVPSTTTVGTHNDNGGNMHQVGTVVSASGTTLVIQPASGANVTFTTSSSTTYQNVSGISSLTAGELVEVDFSTSSTGALLANRVELEPANNSGGSQGAHGNQLTGPVTATSSTGFTLTLMQGLGASVGSSSTGTAYTITTNSGTTYALTPQFQSITGLPFTPTFTSVTPGQTVSVAATSISGTTATATSVTLVPQTISGTVTASSTSGAWTTYTVTLTSGSAFATLSKASTITVYTNTSTTAGSTNPITTGSTYRFNGLVLSTSSGFAMIAGICPDGTPHH